MNSSEFATFISVLACVLAQNKSVEEIELLSAFFGQLSTTLTTITFGSSN
jgi:hypothetical protein